MQQTIPTLDAHANHDLHEHQGFTLQYESIKFNCVPDNTNNNFSSKLFN
jgi:hypothetical protein